MCGPDVGSDEEESQKVPRAGKGQRRLGIESHAMCPPRGFLSGQAVPPAGFWEVTLWLWGIRWLHQLPVLPPVPDTVCAGGGH